MSVLVLADARLFRDALEEALRQRKQFGLISSGPLSEARRRAIREAPDVMLIDVSAEGALDAMRAAFSTLKPPPIVAIGLESEAAALSWIEAGACEYVTRDASVGEIANTIRRAVRGEAACSEQMAGAIFRRLATLASYGLSIEAPEQTVLSERESQVAALITEGLTNKEIALELHISVATVKNHVHRLLHKMHLDRRGKIAAQVRSSLR